MAQPPRGYLAVVVHAKSQQEVGHARPQARRGARDRTSPGRRSRHRDREFPSRDAGEVGAGLGAIVGPQSATCHGPHLRLRARSEEHTSELKSLMRSSYAVFCLKKKKQTQKTTTNQRNIPIKVKQMTFTIT